jgi:hypothetical protein
VLDPTTPELRRLLSVERPAALQADFRAAPVGALRRRAGHSLVAIGLRLAQQPMNHAGPELTEAPADAGASTVCCAA